MPRFDGTGPWGKGSGTGRGLGNCSGQGGFANRRIFGGGGFRNSWARRGGKSALEEEQKALKEELKAVEDELKSLK